jgi:YhcH/YjgK/YiaL family protein
MIVDKINNIGCYEKLVKDSGKIAEFFKSNSLDSIAQAKDKLSIEGTGYSFAPYEIGSGASQEKKWEIHRQHIDIHIVLKGKEYVEWLPVEFLKNSIEYNCGLDVEFFADTVKGSTVIIEPGYFCLCLPQDAHKPSVSGESAGGIKALIKAEVQGA